MANLTGSYEIIIPPWIHRLLQIIISSKFPPFYERREAAIFSSTLSIFSYISLFWNLSILNQRCMRRSSFSWSSSLISSTLWIHQSSSMIIFSSKQIKSVMTYLWNHESSCITFIAFCLRNLFPFSLSFLSFSQSSFSASVILFLSHFAISLIYFGIVILCS